MALALLLSSVLWLRIDPTMPLLPEVPDRNQSGTRQPKKTSEFIRER
jgi:hypothetical protein